MATGVSYVRRRWRPGFEYDGRVMRDIGAGASRAEYHAEA